MSFTISYARQAVKFLKSSDKELLKRLFSKMEVLKEDPVPHDAKSIQGANKLFRIRVGDYRVLYEVDYAEKVIGVIKIDKRSKVYD